VKPSLSPTLSSFAGSVATDTSPIMPEDPRNRRDFASLYRATIAPLRRYLTRLLGNTTEAQDVAHDAYLRVYPNGDKTAADQPEAVLYTTARRLAINRLKRRSISPFSPDGAAVETAASAAPGVAQQVMARQELRLLEDAIAQLPEGCRAVLLLRKVELLSHREISERLGIAVSTVEKQHARALRLLRAALPAESMRNTLSAPSAADAKASS
jgi:RNA polymerase sigma factor (sigma-70 family)